MVRESFRVGAQAQYWVVRREMGGKLPPFIEVRSPIIDTRMKIDIPEGAGSDFLGHDNLVALCMRTMSAVKDWDVIIRKRLADGAHMELAWRFDTNLDWVWWPDDINGNPRTWAVLAGLALNPVCFIHSIPLQLIDVVGSRQGGPRTWRYG